jgi:circadian clock protein KaiC
MGNRKTGNGGSAIPLAKTPTGIPGFDEITGGGLPTGRPALVCGNAGCGKTLFGMEFLVKGATEFNEPGVFVSFEESIDELITNFASLGFDLKGLADQKKLAFNYIFIEPSEIEETGEYNLEGLFIRLGHTIDSVGAKRVVLDTLESLLGGYPNQFILRAEIRRLFRWLKDKGVTAVITAERGSGTLTRHGLEEYVSDCVIDLDHRVTEQVSTRRLRVVKYRGSKHGTNEYPFLIDEGGISVLPITSVGLDYEVSTERVLSGIPRLDTMLDGEGYYRGSSILVSGTAGTGKTSIAAHFAAEACRRGDKCLYFAFEESRHQIIRNMRSIGIDLEPCVEKGLLTFRAVRPTEYGLEMHLAKIYNLINTVKPSAVIIDPVSNLVSTGNRAEVKSLLMRLIDFFKQAQITSLFTSLVTGSHDIEATEVGVSSLMDTWILVRDIESNGERNRALYLLKSRGMPHSNQVREFLMTGSGIDLMDVYVGPTGVLTGAARLVQQSKEEMERVQREHEAEYRRREIMRMRQETELQIASLRAGLEAKEEEFNQYIITDRMREKALARERDEMARLRKADDAAAEKKSNGLTSCRKGGE